MKYLCMLFAAAAILFATPTWATTCVANREFKVHQVCGVVSDKKGVKIPDVRVELLDANSSVIGNVQTNADGDFVFASITDGKYILRIKFDGFATA